MKNPFIITGNIPEKYFCDRREEAAKLYAPCQTEVTYA